MKIAITGPESSGKTTLATALSKYYDCAYVSEFARRYLEQLDRPYNEQDLDQITRGQVESEQKSLNTELLICDTDILTLKIWSMEKFGNVSNLVQKAFENSHYDLTFLMVPNFPWVYDPLRENEHDQERLFDIYVEALTNSGTKFIRLGGNIGERLTLAIKEIENLHL